MGTLASAGRPVTIDRARLDRQKRDLALGHAAGDVSDEAYLGRMNELRGQTAGLERAADRELGASRAVEWLRAFADAWRDADVAEAKAELIHAIYERVIVAGRRFVEVRLGAQRGRERPGYRCIRQPGDGRVEGDVPSWHRKSGLSRAHRIMTHGSLRGIAYAAVELGDDETPIEAADDLQRDPGIPPAPIKRVLDCGPVKAIGAVAPHDLAAWALATEMGDGRELEDLHMAAERTCKKLCQRLSALVTVEGYKALLARAMQVAAVEFPFLGKSSKGPSTSSPCLGGFAASDGIPKATVHDGLTAVLAGVIGLSITFIGEGLTVRAVREVWPDAPASAPDGLRQEDQQ